MLSWGCGDLLAAHLFAYLFYIFPSRQNSQKQNSELKRYCFYILCIVHAVHSRVQVFVTPWTVAHQAPLSIGLSWQQYWSRLPFPPPGDLPDPRIEPMFPELAGGFFTTEPPGKPHLQTEMALFLSNWNAIYFHILL